MESEEHFEAVFYSGKNNSPLQHIIHSLYSELSWWRKPVNRNNYTDEHWAIYPKHISPSELNHGSYS